MAILDRGIGTLFALVIFLLVSSCEGDKLYGFPEKVDFPQDGGEITLSGEMGPITIDFIFDDDTQVWKEDGIVYERNSWLTVSWPGQDRSEIWVTIKAEPNTTGKKRSQRLELDFGRYYGEIKVTQHK